jgi:hypothetical protein
MAADLPFTFRNAGPSGHGVGRIRYFVDTRDRCIGSVEGKTGDFRLDADYVSEGQARKDTKTYMTRVKAAHALAALTTTVDLPPVSAAEYRILQRCKKSGETFVMPVLGFARILSSRDLLTAKRGTSEFRTTAEGLKMIQRYEDWVAKRLADKNGETR